jgi:hypothetical protein
MSPGISTVEDRTDLIRKRAYELYLRRGCSPGSEIEDWLLAEREVEGLLKQRPLSSPPPARSQPAPSAQPGTAQGLGKGIAGRR